MEKVACWPEESRVAGRKAREVMGRAASWAAVADGYREALESVRTPGVPAAPSPRRVGVNVFADPRATTGLAEAGRRYAVALLDAGADPTFTEFHCGWPNRSVPVPKPLTRVRGGKDHPVDLWLLNLNEFHLIPDHALDRYTIGLWAWELPDVLESSIAELKRLDELWVMSSFTAEAFRTVTDIPIMVVPSVVTGFEGVPADRARFGLPEDGAVVLFSFSASSGDARKNPWGVVEAFRRAFPSGERGSRAHLVIKATDLQRFPAMAEALTEAMANVGGTLINEDLARPEMDQLLATCDIYLSLHRSEGFGLGMAEAMALGKAVVATGYGGNTDFMPPGSAAMVGYRIREITAADHRYAPEVGHWTRPGHLWAEPDVDQAARWLRRLAASESLRRSMGAAAVRAIHAHCDSAVVGAIMVRRLEELATSLPTR
jgi:glycosyltransferase involved in cell wall biosynthesis